MCNYRGITVGPVSAKLFAMIIDSESAGLPRGQGSMASKPRGQAGFRVIAQMTLLSFLGHSLTSRNRLGRRERVASCTVVLLSPKKRSIQYRVLCCSRC